MSVAEIIPQVRAVLEGMKGETVDQKIARLLINEFRRRIEDCEQEILALELKYGMMYDQFERRIQGGELGDPFSYSLEQDAMRWEDLLTEKKHWLSELKELQELPA